MMLGERQAAVLRIFAECDAIGDGVVETDYIAACLAVGLGSAHSTLCSLWRRGLLRHYRKTYAPGDADGSQCWRIMRAGHAALAEWEAKHGR